MGTMINRRRACGGKSLPYDAEIEYLESSGTQYIDTGICPDKDTIAEVVLMIFTTSSGPGYFGSRVVGGDRFQIVDSIGLGKGYYHDMNYYPTINKRHKISLYG